MNICGLNKTTLLDYPGRVACTIFLGGCNLRCPFCHNGSLALGTAEDAFSMEDIFSFLKKRRGILTGVCISGGEPAINAALPDFIAKIKKLGYKVKLDTNGTNPEMLDILIYEKLIDYCAMDIKNSFEKYDASVNFEGSGILPSYDIEDIKKSAALLLSQSCHDEDGFSYEFRTTLVRQLHSEDDIISICRSISGTRAYFLQPYKESGGVLDKRGFCAHDDETLERFLQICRGYIPNTQLRG